MNHSSKNLFTPTIALIALLLALVLVAAAAPAQAASTDKAAVKKGVSWMSHASLKQFPGAGFQADALVALAAARRGGTAVRASSRERFLKAVRGEANSYATTAGSTAKVIIAAVAGGENPRCFGPGRTAAERSDFVDALMADYDSRSGQFGSTAFDHGLALIALKAAHVKSPSKAVRFAKQRRGKFGWGFGLVKRGGDDVESSAVMIQGLRAAGVKKSDGALRAAMSWVTYQRNADGGYNPNTSTTAGETQADATSYVILAADAMGTHRGLMKKAKRALRALQQRDGSFRAQPSANSAFKGISTSNAVLALSGRHLPVVRRKTAPKPCS